MKKVIKVKLDPQSIADAIREIEEYKADLEKRVRLLLKTLTDRGVEIAKAKVVEHGIIHDAELTNSIHGYLSVSLGAGFIRVDDKNAVFFEFGTGPVGASNPHPLGPTYTTDAWVTKADGKPMNELYGWTPLPYGDGETYYLTFGQKSKPFMYETALQLRDEFPAIVKEVFG
jgi:hypothetical protein